MVHHTYYVKGRLPWEYPNHSLITLCINCHEIIHEKKKAAKYNKERLVGEGRISEEPLHIKKVLFYAIKKMEENAKKIYGNK